MNDHRKRYLVADGRVSFAKVNKFLLEKYAKCEVDYALDADVNGSLKARKYGAGLIQT